MNVLSNSLFSFGVSSFTYRFQAVLIFSKSLDGTINYNKPSKYLKDYFGAQGKVLDESLFSEAKNSVSKEDNVNQNVELDTL